MDVKVDLDDRVLQHALEWTGKKTRWLITLSLTRTAFDARAPLADSAESQFHERGSGWMRRGIRAEKATPQTLTARVGTASEVMEDLVVGGPRHAVGRIPTQLLRTDTQRVSKRQGVDVLLRKKTKPRAFIPRVDNPAGVFRRRGKDRYPIDLLWRFPRKTPKMEAAWKMAAIVARSVNSPTKGFSAHFMRAFRKALLEQK